MTGGQGFGLTIARNGRFMQDLGAGQPVTGSDGANQYQVVYMGTGSGSASTADGKLTLAYDDPTAITVDVYVNNNLQGQDHPQGSGVSTYTCNGSTLVLHDSSGGTTTFARAGG
jgi:hypothetical protein